MTSKNETILELWRAQERHCYFMMSGAGASIGYAITKIGATDVSKLWHLLIALLVWGISFICGYYSLKFRRGSMMVNIQKLNEENLLPQSNTHMKQILLEVAGQALGEIGRKQERTDAFQVMLLILGAIVFVSSQLDFELVLSPLKSFFLTP